MKILLPLLPFLFYKSSGESQFEFFKSRCDSNCTFEPYHLNSETFKLFPSNCSAVCAYLLIDGNSDLSENDLKFVFKNVKVLYGFLNVKNTKLEDLKFLKGLEKLECDEKTSLKIEYNSEMTTIGMTNFSTTNCDILFFKNEKLEKLELPNLNNFFVTDSNNYVLPQITTKDPAPNFCMTLEEVTNFLRNDFYEIARVFEGQYCGFATTIKEISGEKVCEIRNFTLSNFDESCKRIIGNIRIKNGDEQYVKKLANVTWIFGTVKVYYTELEAIDFFDSLEYVTVVPDNVFDIGIEVVHNRNLKNAVFPKLKKVRDKMVFEQNHKDFVMDPSICLGTKNGLNITDFRHTLIDGHFCADFLDFSPSHEKDKGSSEYSFHGIIGIWFLITFNF